MTANRALLSHMFHQTLAYTVTLQLSEDKQNWYDATLDAAHIMPRWF